MKMFIATRKIRLRQTLEAEGHEKLVANRFGVVTQYIPVAIRTRLLISTQIVQYLALFIACFMRFLCTNRLQSLNCYIGVPDLLLITFCSYFSSFVGRMRSISSI